ncbi:MAG: GNAT family N-acetyltransferase [Clostridia bacterium]
MSRIEFRMGAPDDLPAIARLADQAFDRTSPRIGMAACFPHLFHPDNAHHWAVAVDGIIMVGIAGSMVWNTELAGAAVRVASLGSVATAEGQRRRGIASRLLQLAESSLNREGARLMLISGDRPLYRRFGARPVGRVDWYRVPPGLAVPGTFEVRDIDPAADAAAVARLSDSRTVRFERSLSLLQILLAVQPLTRVEDGSPVTRLVFSGGTAVSYVCVSHHPQNSRKPSVVVEWAGSAAGMLWALASLADRSHSGVMVPVLPEDDALRWCLGALSPTSSLPYPGLAKVLDGEGLAADFAECWRARAGTAPTVHPVDGGRYRIAFRAMEWVVDPPTLTAWIFGHDVNDRPEALSEIWPSPGPWPEGLNFI